MAQIQEHRDPVEILIRIEARAARNRMRCAACLRRPRDVGGEGWCKTFGSHREGCGFRLDEKSVERMR